MNIPKQSLFLYKYELLLYKIVNNILKLVKNKTLYQQTFVFRIIYLDYDSISRKNTWRWENFGN